VREFLQRGGGERVPHPRERGGRDVAWGANSKKKGRLGSKNAKGMLASKKNLTRREEIKKKSDLGEHKKRKNANHATETSTPTVRIDL